MLPLQFPGGQDAASLGLTGDESYAVRGLAGAAKVPRTVTAAGPAGTREFAATVRIDTPAEAAYCRHGGILPYVLPPPRRPLKPLFPGLLLWRQPRSGLRPPSPGPGQRFS